MPKDLSVQQSVQTLFKRGKGVRKAGTKAKSTKQKTGKVTKEYERKGSEKTIEYEFMYGSQHVNIWGSNIGTTSAFGFGLTQTSKRTGWHVGVTESQGTGVSSILNSDFLMDNLQVLLHPNTINYLYSQEKNLNLRLKTLYNGYVRNKKGPGRPKNFDTWLKDFYEENPEIFTGGLGFASGKGKDDTVKAPLSAYTLARYAGDGNVKLGASRIGNLTPTNIKIIGEKIARIAVKEQMETGKTDTAQQIFDSFVTYLDYRHSRAYQRQTYRDVNISIEGGPENEENTFIYESGGPKNGNRKHIANVNYLQVMRKFFPTELGDNDDIGDKGISYIKKKINEKLKEISRGKKITTDDIETALKNAQDLHILVQQLNLTDPTIGGPETIMDALSFLELAATKKNLKLPGIGSDVIEWYKESDETTIARSDIEAYYKDDYRKEKILQELDEKGFLDKETIMEIRRRTHGLVGSLNPPDVQTIMDALKKGIRRQIPRNVIRTENWFRCAEKNFGGSKLLPVLLDLASRVSDTMGYKALFEPDTEINDWYPQEDRATGEKVGGDSSEGRIMKLIESLEEGSGLKANWWLMEDLEEYIKDNDDKGNPMLMAYNYLITKYGTEENFPDELTKYFKREGII